MMRRIRHTLSSLHRDETASVAAEAVLMLPLLAWVYAASFVFFDAFRAVNTSVKAAYALSDLLSRETNPVTADYIEGMNDVFDYLANAEAGTSIRVSTIRWDGDDEEYDLLWSYATKSRPQLTQASVTAMSDNLPLLADGDTIIMLETRLDHAPIFDVGIAPRTLTEVIFTRPRFAPQLLFSGSGV